VAGRRIWKGRIALSLALAGIASALAPSAEAAPSCTPAGANIVCTYSTVGTDTFTVPPGVTSVTFVAFGAQGGNFAPFRFGGLGGSGTSAVSVSSGQILQVNVGGVGGNDNSAVPNGGFNGGGSGGAATVPGAGGGGASDVRTSPFALADRVVVGGGGGGVGPTDGGAGGGTTGGSGSNAEDGKGGTQSDPGAGGATNGNPGGFGFGGAGGDATGRTSGGGAGGGGGYYGGGGGSGFSGGFTGVGGGGSGFGTTLGSGVRSGNGQVTATYAGASLRVVKSLSPAADPGKFNLQIDGTTQAADVGDGGNTGQQTVVPGTRTVGETAGTATSLSDYTSSIVCRADDGAGSMVASGSGPGPFDVPVSSGDQIACTITNTRTGALRVIKSLSPVADPGRFNLQIDGATQAADVGDGGNTGLQALNPGTHTVQETAGAATSLADYTRSITCKDEDGAGSTVASGPGSGPLDVSVASDEQIACTITNVRSAGPTPPETGEDPRCGRLREKLKRQQRHRAKARTKRKRAFIRHNIGQTRTRLTALGCATA
jgi:hypothetical protein